MALYKLSQSAAAKVRDIYAFSVTNFGLQTANDYIDSLHRTFLFLAENPLIGRPFYRYRRHEHRSHILFYREIPKGIRIVQILHQSEDVVAKLDALDD